MSLAHLMSDVSERLGWLLVHSLWQFALIALAALLLERAMHRSSATARYWVLLGAFGAMLAAPITTWFVLPQGIPREQASAAEAPILKTPTSEDFSGVASPHATVQRPSPVEAPEELTTRAVPPIASFTLPTGESESATPSIAARLSDSLETWSSWITHRVQPWLATLVMAWCVGVLAFSVRPILSWSTVRRLRLVGVSPVPDDLGQLLHRIAARLQIRSPVSLLQSTLVQLPCVVGYFRPVILLPMSLASGLSPAEVEAILAHELAHVRRYDYLVNLLQTLVETLFFYHPAIWWLSHRIRCERENCCDDIAAAVVGDKVEYSRALLALEQRRGAVTTLAVGAGGGSLLARVRRLFGVAPSRAISGGSIVGLGLFAVVTIAVGVVWAANGLGEPDSGAAQAPEETEIARLIKQLGHDDFGKREAAKKGLVEIGEPALDALNKAQTSDEPEVRFRAEEITTVIENRSFRLFRG